VARILIVDDNLLCRSLMRQILVDAGHLIAGEAKDGLEAPAKVRDLRPDLVTLDLVMPNRGGMATLQHLMMLDHSLPVVLCAAFPSEQRVITAVRLGAKGLILKPFERAAVVETVTTALAGVTLRPVPMPATPVVTEPVIEEEAPRREFIRINAGLRVVVASNSRRDKLHTFTMNLSGSGMLLASGTLEQDEQIDFELFLSARGIPIEGTARVVRFDEHKRAALEFEQIAVPDYERLVAYIRANSIQDLAATA
jgi:two-component system chemotaxis response regulator CheY